MKEDKMKRVRMSLTKGSEPQKRRATASEGNVSNELGLDLS